MGVAHIVLLALGSGCGRVAFDLGATGDGGAPLEDGAGLDATPSPGFVISTTSLTSSQSFSFVELAVDWTRELAYLGTRETGECFAVVDFSSTPMVIARGQPPLTSGTRCLGVELEANGSRLLVTSEAAGTIDLIELGDDPRTGAYTQLGSKNLVGGPRRIARDVVTPTRIYVAANNAGYGIQPVAVLGSSPWLLAAVPYASSTPCPDHGNDVASLASDTAVVGCATNDTPVEIVGGQSMSLEGTVPAVLGGDTSGFWAAGESADGQIAALAGWVTVILQTGGAQGATQRARVNNDHAYRGVTLVDRGGGLQMWAARSDGVVEVLSLTDPSDPVVIGRAVLGSVGEAYAIGLDPGAPRGIVITNRGDFVLFDPRVMPAVSERWPAF